MAAAIIDATAPAAGDASTSTAFTVIGQTACGVRVGTAQLSWLLPGRPAARPVGPGPREGGDTVPA